MHQNEIEIDSSLARNLIREQFPQWGELAVNPVASSGTDNTLFRLGNEMVARFPRVEWACLQVEKEYTCLPKLGPHLPLAYRRAIATHYRSGAGS